MAVTVQRACFGPFEADLHTGELWRSGARIELQELPFRVLAALIERRGALVTREELRGLTWDAGVHVDFDHGLNKAINKIRRVLQDDPEDPRYIETLPRRGYRFIASVRTAGPSPATRPETETARDAPRLLWDGRTIPLPEGENVVGRDPATAVWIDSSTVSRRHARIAVSAGRAVLEDLGSKNGTFRGGRRLEAPEELTDGDEITVGSVRMTFRSAGGSESTRTASR
jgi:DNA-binding winged helix-turn-helix (wHTH) protein